MRTAAQRHGRFAPANLRSLLRLAIVSEGFPRHLGDSDRRYGMLGFPSMKSRKFRTGRASGGPQSFFGPILSFARDTKALLLTLMLCLIASGCLACFWKDMGLNLVSEFVGVFFTVAFVDRIYKIREEKRNLPLRVTAFNDVARLVNSIVSFWMETSQQCVPNKLPDSTEEMLSAKGLQRIADHLNLDGSPRVFPPRTWWEYLPEHSNEVTAICEKILERHAIGLDPEAFHLVYEILHGYLYRASNFNIISTVRLARQRHGLSHPPVLSGYWLPIDHDISPIRSLYKWAMQEHEALLEQNASNVRGVTEGPKGQQVAPEPPSMVSQDIVEQLVKARAALEAQVAATPQRHAEPMQ